MHTYSHAWVLLYAFIYFPWFTYLERHVTDNYFVIHSIFDDYIPFCEYFIIPYLCGLLILQSHWDICSLMINRDFTKPPRSCSAV